MFVYTDTVIFLFRAEGLGKN